MEKLKRITFDPEIMEGGGKPCVRGMRVTVGMIVRPIELKQKETVHEKN